MKVLIVEDEESYVEALSLALEVEGIDSVAAMDGRVAIREFRAGRFDVVLLDLMLPSVSGLDVLRAIRKEAQTPVIVVSAKNTEIDVVTALELGADDYLSKPYSGRELIARIHAVSRRAQTAEPEFRVTVGNTSLDAERYQLDVAGDVFDLPRKEFEVMSMLMARAGRIVTRERILDEVWGLDWGETKSLDQHIRRLRRKLEQNEDTPPDHNGQGSGVSARGGLAALGEYLVPGIWYQDSDLGFAGKGNPKGRSATLRSRRG